MLWKLNRTNFETVRFCLDQELLIVIQEHQLRWGTHWLFQNLHLIFFPHHIVHLFRFTSIFCIKTNLQHNTPTPVQPVAYGLLSLASLLYLSPNVTLISSTKAVGFSLIQPSHLQSGVQTKRFMGIKKTLTVKFGCWIKLWSRCSALWLFTITI